MQQRPTRVRHLVLWLTVAAYMITYMDRVVISSAAPKIREEFGFSLETMGLILGAFRWGYSFFQIPGGWLGDRFGPRRALTLIVLWWSAFTSLTAVMTGAVSMGICRFLFGVGEAGAFPIATRSLSRWMLPAERGWAQGLHAADRGVDDPGLRLADAVPGIRLHGHWLGAAVVLLVSRHAGGAPAGERRRTRTD
jgi:MFS family permease